MPAEIYPDLLERLPADFRGRYSLVATSDVTRRYAGNMIGHAPEEDKTGLSKRLARERLSTATED
ncbi:MAG: hypothetical protein ABI351_05790 [Herbaspirillum sp.]